MTGAEIVEPPADRSPGVVGYVVPISAGLAIVVAIIIPWMLLARLNAEVRPGIPWATVVTLAYLTAMLLWLSGVGPPARSRAWRRRHLRLRPASDAAAHQNGDLSTGSIVVLLGLIYVAWTVMSRGSTPPDLIAYPTTSYRWSMFLMGGLMSGVVEEVAFRGYMQRGMESHDYGNAVWITSAVFVLLHITHGLAAVLVLAPGLFVVSLLYGSLARRTGTILPGIAIHVVGDLARTYFGVLGGDWRMLFVT
jgi:membrane protease YdiL (CAAX protease family)